MSDSPGADLSDWDALEPDVLAAVTQAMALSAETRRIYPTILAQHYGPGALEYLDIYPARQPDAPVLVFLPGAVAGLPMCAEDFAGVARGPFAHGITTVVVNYVHAPAVTPDEASRQVAAAIVWVYDNAEQFGADPERIVVAGHAAGAPLAVGAAVTDWEDEYGVPAGVVTGVVAVSGRFSPQPSTGWAVPPVFARRVEVPIIVAVGDREPDDLQRQSGELVDRLTDGGTAVLLDLPGADQHGSFAGYCDPQSPLTLATVALITTGGRSLRVA
ncbi:MAG: alpha/beta hydrolase [Cryobacterium sp.]